jgi:hypothetical protein
MSTDEVTALCRRVVEGTGCTYLGTYPAWGGPDVAEWAKRTKKEGDTAFVANTDTVEDEGTHWTLFYLPRDVDRPPYFYDSFGRDPARMGRPMWRNYLTAIADRRMMMMMGPTTTTTTPTTKRPYWERNAVRMQERHTAVCGQLCGMVLYLLSRKMNIPKKIVKEKTIERFLSCL